MTAEELEALPADDRRYELICGELVSMPPVSFRHGGIVARITGELERFVRRNHLGMVASGDPGFILERGPDTVRAPDIAFVRADRLPDDLRHFLELAPDLAVEIVSPSERMTNVRAKARAYLDAGVRLVWIVQPEGRRVSVYHADQPPRELGEGDVPDGEDVVPGFQMPLADIFNN